MNVQTLGFLLVQATLRQEFRFLLLWLHHRGRKEGSVGIQVPCTRRRSSLTANNIACFRFSCQYDPMDHMHPRIHMS